MGRPHYTAGSESSFHIDHAGYCASDLVFQTAGIVLNESDKVMLLEDPLTNAIALPRSCVPHSLDDLLSAPLGFLNEVGYTVDPLPVCLPAREYGAQRAGVRPALTFTEYTSTSPFAMALDLAYIPFSNIHRLADGRQSLVLWYGCRVRDHPANRKRVHFMSFEDAVDVIEGQPLPDITGIRALRLFGKLLAATKRLPLEVKPSAEDCGPGSRSSGTQLFVRHAEDITCYPAAVMEDPIFPVPTPNTTDIVMNAFWAASDFYVQTGVILFDKQRDLVLLRAGSLPRCTGNDVTALLREPLGGLVPESARIALPRLSKRYEFVVGSDTPIADTAVEFGKTTNPFFVTLNTWWDVKAKTTSQSRGRQGITIWYSGMFDVSAPLPDDCTAVPLTQALARLQGTDPYASVALTLFSELWNIVKDD